MADLSLDKEMLKAVIRKKGLELAELRKEAAFVSTEFGQSERTACKPLGVDRSSYHDEPRADRSEELMKLARQRPRFGYRRLHVILERRGHAVNVKRVYRLYAEAGLAVPKSCSPRICAGPKSGRSRWCISS